MLEGASEPECVYLPNAAKEPKPYVEIQGF